MKNYADRGSVLSCFFGEFVRWPMFGVKGLMIGS